MVAKTHTIVLLVSTICALAMLVVLVGFDVYPLLSGNDALAIQQQAWLQVARDEYLAKDVLILEYRGDTNRSRAVSDLQTLIPQMEQTQNGFLNGDQALGLPSDPSDTTKRILFNAQTDFVPMITALKVILTHPDVVPDTTQVNIVLLHDYPYSVTMAQLALFLQQESEQITLHITVIKIGIKLLLFGAVFSYYVFWGRTLVKKQESPIHTIQAP